jgi:hypothetical protein
MTINLTEIKNWLGPEPMLASAEAYSVRIVRALVVEIEELQQKLVAAEGDLARERPMTMDYLPLRAVEEAATIVASDLVAKRDHHKGVAPFGFDRHVDGLLDALKAHQDLLKAEQGGDTRR